MIELQGGFGMIWSSKIHVFFGVEGLLLPLVPKEKDFHHAIFSQVI